MIRAGQGIDVKIIHPGNGVQRLATVDQVLFAIVEKARLTPDLLYGSAIGTGAGTKPSAEDYNDDDTAEGRHTHGG
jgi:hypothetical protein